MAAEFDFRKLVQFRTARFLLAVYEPWRIHRLVEEDASYCDQRRLRRYCRTHRTFT